MRKIVFHSFNMGDVEDPEIYAAFPIMEWEKSEVGKWVMENAVETPSWHLRTDHGTYGYRVDIVGALKEIDEVYYRLKYDNLQRTHR
jgi:hypothetical protein